MCSEALPAAMGLPLVTCITRDFERIGLLLRDPFPDQGGNA